MLPISLINLKELKELKLKGNPLGWVPKEAQASVAALVAFLKTQVPKDSDSSSGSSSGSSLGTGSSIAGKGRSATLVPSKVARVNLTCRVLSVRGLAASSDRYFVQGQFRDQKFPSKAAPSAAVALFELQFSCPGIAPGDNVLLEVFSKEINPANLVGSSKVLVVFFDALLGSHALPDSLERHCRRHKRHQGMPFEGRCRRCVAAGTGSALHAAERGRPCPEPRPSAPGHTRRCRIAVGLTTGGAAGGGSSGVCRPPSGCHQARCKRAPSAPFLVSLGSLRWSLT
jgi:hypothetical protein